MEEEEAAKTLLKPKNHTWKQKLKTGHYAKWEKKLPLLSRAGKQPSRKNCLEIPLHQGHRRVALEAQKIVTRRIAKKERCWERDRERQRDDERERERTKSRRQFEGLHFQVVDSAHPDCQILTTADLFLCSICWKTLLRRNKFRLSLHSHGLGLLLSLIKKRKFLSRSTASEYRKMLAPPLEA